MSLQACLATLIEMGKGPRKKSKFGFNPKVAKLTVTKLEIVQREIDTCADLYFSFGDLVSMHVLASAAYEILAVFDKEISKTGMLFDDVEQYIKAEYLDDYRNLMKSPYVGFKHGTKDLDAFETYSPGAKQFSSKVRNPSLIGVG
jgi:hypothetical protein